MNRSIAKLYLITIVCLLLNACGLNEKVNTLTGSTMGTTYTIKTFGGMDVSQLQIDNRLQQINQIFSTWDKDSELSRLNQQPVNQWIRVSDELFYVLKVSKDLYQKTQGYFDPGIGRLIDLWGFGAIKTDQKPSRFMVAEQLENASIQYLELDAGRVKKTRDIHINLSAIAKGYGVDEVAKLLNSKNYLIEIGGEVLSRGSNQGKEWTLGVERPDGGPPIAIALNNQAIATSGNYRNYFVWEGRRYMHILNPSDGLPADTDLASVSVLDTQTMMADAYATAMMAMGGKKAAALAEQLDLSVILIFNQQNHFKVVKINQ